MSVFTIFTQNCTEGCTLCSRVRKEVKSLGTVNKDKVLIDYGLGTVKNLWIKHCKQCIYSSFF
jgi:hypothetical protein